MLISCPNCSTKFSVPDPALGGGRKVKCGRCHHVWFQAGDAPAAPARRAAPAPEPEFNPDFGDDDRGYREPEPDFGMDDDFGGGAKGRDDSAPVLEDEAPLETLSLDDPATTDNVMGLDSPPIPDFARPEGDEPPIPFNVDLDSAPQPIPEMFATPKPHKPTAVLWILLILLLLFGGGGAAYYYQDKVVSLWPGAGDLLSSLGLRREKPGTGLELRNAGTPERFVQNDVEVLIVRGIIANISERERSVPTMKLVLLDRNKAVVQEKLTPPPVSFLDPGGTAGFKVTLERPDVNAVEVNVLFVGAEEKAAKK